VTRPYKPRDQPPVHGSRSTYTGGCRCELCRTANAQRELRRRDAAITRSTLVPVASSWIVARNHPVRRVCSRHKKRKYRSRNQALRAGEAKYGVRTEAYLCPKCGRWHLTRRGTRLDDQQREHFKSIDAAEQLVSALGIGGDES
jgi:hypothetical protein